MNQESYCQARKEGFCCGMSLAKALQEAGGRIPDGETIGKMTIEEFIIQVAAQNNIRFVYPFWRRKLLHRRCKVGTPTLPFRVVR